MEEDVKLERKFSFSYFCQNFRGKLLFALMAHKSMYIFSEKSIQMVKKHFAKPFFERKLKIYLQKIKQIVIFQKKNSI
jgi:hypothetical protein